MYKLYSYFSIEKQRHRISTYTDYFLGNTGRRDELRPQVYSRVINGGPVNASASSHSELLEDQKNCPARRITTCIFGFFFGGRVEPLHRLKAHAGDKSCFWPAGLLCWKARIGSTFQIAHKFVNAKNAPKAVFWHSWHLINRYGSYRFENWAGAFR